MWIESKQCPPAVSHTPLFKGGRLSQHLSLDVYKLNVASQVTLLTVRQHQWRTSSFCFLKVLKCECRGFKVSPTDVFHN